MSEAAAVATSRGTNARFVLIGSGVLVCHTLVTVLEESLFTNEAFLRDAGGAFSQDCTIRTLDRCPGP